MHEDTCFGLLPSGGGGGLGQRRNSRLADFPRAQLFRRGGGRQATDKAWPHQRGIVEGAAAVLAILPLYLG